MKVLCSVNGFSRECLHILTHSPSQKQHLKGVWYRTTKVFCNQVNAVALGCQLQCPFLLGNGRKEIAIPAIKACKKNLAQDIGDGGKKIDGQGTVPRQTKSILRNYQL